MALPLTTTYLRHRISIEPFEWGYLAKITEPDSDHELVTVGSSAIGALENAFEFIDARLNAAKENSLPHGRVGIGS